MYSWKRVTNFEFVQSLYLVKAIYYRKYCLLLLFIYDVHITTKAAYQNIIMV